MDVIDSEGYADRDADGKLDCVEPLELLVTVGEIVISTVGRTDSTATGSGEGELEWTCGSAVLTSIGLELGDKGDCDGAREGTTSLSG